MTTAEQYARALFDSQAHDARLLKALRVALAARGHEKLLPQILSAYQKLELGKKRVEAYRTVSPETRRTDALLELYQKLVATK